MIELRLIKAPQADPRRSLERFANFLKNHPNPFVTNWDEDVIRSAIGDESVFFVENEMGNVIATTCFYRHGSEDDLWGEFGGTLVDENYRGGQLQLAIYRHIICLKWLSDWPPHVIAIVDENAVHSWKNVERCGFERLLSVPAELINATRGRNWGSVAERRKRLYQLADQGIVDSLLFVSERGQTHPLIDKNGEYRFRLFVDFAYLAQPDARDVLYQEAQDILKRKE